MATSSWSDLLNAAEEGGVSFDPLPVGEYLIEIASAEYKPARTGKDMYVVRAKVIAGPYAGKSVFHNFVLTEDNPNALAFFFRHMAALGLGKEFFAQNPQPSQVAASLEGRQAKIKVKQREYPKGSGEMRNDVDGWFKADGAVQVQAPQPGVPQVQPQQQFQQAPAPVVQQQPAPQQFQQAPEQQFQQPVAQPVAQPQQQFQQPVAQQPASPAVAPPPPFAV